MSARHIALVLGALGVIVQAGSARVDAQQTTQSPPPSPSAAEPGQGGAAGQQPEPTFRTGISFVRVDVIVSDGKQQPVMDLTQADFDVLEDGKPQSIEQFKLIRIDGNPRPGDPPPSAIRGRFDEEREAAREDVRLFLIFLDDYHVRLGSSLSVKDPLTRFVQTQLGPNDLVAVMSPLTPVDGISFTRNHQLIVGAIERFEGRKFRYEPRNQFEEQYARYPTEIVEDIRNQVVMSALRGAATRLGSLREGRKAILFVSEGFTGLLPPQMRNADASMPMPCLPGTAVPAGCNPAAGSPMAGENNPREETARVFAMSDVYLRMREIFDAANRNNTAIYTVDPRGLSTGEFGIDENIGPKQDRAALLATQDTLRSLAEETDGRAIVNRNDLAGGLAQVVRDSSAYYLLGYTSSAAPTDGKFHDITVRVKRRGVTVRSRKGYWAATAADTVRAASPAPEAPRAIQQALASIATSVQAARYVQTWVGTERGDAGKTRVTIVWESLPQPPGARRPQPGRVSLLAADDKGNLLFRGRSPENTPSSPTAGGGGANGASGQAAVGSATGSHRIVFEAPPGKVELRMSVEASDGGGVLDNEVRTVSVPDLTGPDAAIGTPRVHRARNAREFQLLAADAAAVPVAARQFSRTERLLIRFPVYGSATPIAALMNRSGQKIGDLPVSAGGAPGTYQLDVGLNTVPPGEYLIEISVTGATGTATELTAVRVVS